MHSVRAQSLGGHHYFLKQRAAQVCECAQTEWAQPPRRQGGGHISLFFTMLCKASQREAGEWVAVPLKSLALFKREKMPAFLPHKHTLSDCTALCIPPYSFSTLCLLAEDSFKNSPRTILACWKAAHGEWYGPYTTGPEYGDHLRLSLPSLVDKQVNISVEILFKILKNMFMYLI